MRFFYFILSPQYYFHQTAIHFDLPNCNDSYFLLLSARITLRRGLLIITEAPSPLPNSRRLTLINKTLCTCHSSSMLQNIDLFSAMLQNDLWYPLLLVARNDSNRVESFSVSVHSFQFLVDLLEIFLIGGEQEQLLK